MNKGLKKNCQKNLIACAANADITKNVGWQFFRLF